MVSSLKNYFFKPVEYEEISEDNSRKEEREKMLAWYKKSSQEIWIVAGELDSGFYNDDFAKIIKQKLQKNQNFRARILFSKDENADYKERMSKIFNENGVLCQLLKDGAFEGRFAMILSKKRPENHFGIVDNNILIEKIHKQGEERDVLLVKNYKSLVEKYKKYFIKLTSNSDNISKRLTFDDFKEFQHDN